MPQSNTVPVFPFAAARAAELFRVSNPQLEDVLPVVELDPGLTAAVLRAANSAASNPMEQVRTARVAIMRIGAGWARRIVLGQAVSKMFANLGRSGIDTDELWLHLCACAIIADNLALSAGEHGEAFTAGLLHDVGRLAMAAGDPERYLSIVRDAQRGEDISEAERAAFGATHAEWGAEVCVEWGFPTDLVRAIADHHEGGTSGLAWSVATARTLARSLGIGDGVLQASPSTPPGELLEIARDLGGVEAVLREARSLQRSIRPAA